MVNGADSFGSLQVYILSSEAFFLSEHQQSLTLHMSLFVVFNLLTFIFIVIGVDGGFDNNEPEFEETYEIVVLPNYATLPFPSVELPEKVFFFPFLSFSLFFPPL